MKDLDAPGRESTWNLIETADKIVVSVQDCTVLITDYWPRENALCDICTS